MKRILLIHGILHTTEIFNNLEEALPDCVRCTRFYLPGLDDSKDVTIESHIELLGMHLRNNHYDLVVAHSYGAFLVLNNLRECKDLKILLLNPLMGNMSYDLRKNIWLFDLLPLARALCKYKFFRKFLLKLAELTCNDKTKLDDSILDGLLKSGNSISKLLLATNSALKTTCIPEIHMIYGSNDRIIDSPKSIHSLCHTAVAISCGHSSFMEREDYIVCRIKELIGIQ